MATLGGPARFPAELVADGRCGGLARGGLWRGCGGLDLTYDWFHGRSWCWRHPGESARQVADHGVERWIRRRLAIGDQVGCLRASSAAAAGGGGNDSASTQD
jgi:hypothetical protein